MYSEKATKFFEISTLLLTGTTQDKREEEISQNFVVFSEYMNFILPIQFCLGTFADFPFEGQFAGSPSQKAHKSFKVVMPIGDQIFQLEEYSCGHNDDKTFEQGVQDNVVSFEIL